MLPTELRDRFREVFPGEPRLFRAPGRVNLIGEHTDYNDGFVLPAAIDLATVVAAAPRADRRLVVRSENLSGATAELDLDSPGERAGDWRDYPFGVALEIERSGRKLPGANLLVRGDVPLGSGLSSSAAIEVATALALLDLSGHSPDRVTVARICQRAEHDRVGTRCGIMDPFASLHGRAGHALLLDCRSLECREIPVPPGVRIVVCDTRVRHALADGEYNRRRAACEEGVAAIARSNPHVRALRDASLEDLERARGALPEAVLRRCRHVITENARTLAAAEALRAGDFAALSRLMAASHASLAADYEVSCPELDLLVRIAAARPGVIGARMTGGGFGGCTVNLVREDAAGAFRAAVTEAYERETGRTPSIHACAAAAGAAPWA